MTKLTSASSLCRRSSGQAGRTPARRQASVWCWSAVVAVASIGAVLWTAPVQAGSTITRTSSFDYEPASGILVKEVIEPNVSDQCVVTSYGLDPYGRKVSVSTRNCNGSAGVYPGATAEAAAPTAPSTAPFAPRAASSAFGTDQRFVTSSTNGLTQTETKAYDGRFGLMTSLTGPNQLTTGWAYDDFGRKLLEKRADGNGTRWQYTYCTSVAGGTLTCPTIAGAVGAYAVTATPVAAPIDLAAKTAGAANGPYSRTYFDAMGREIRSETQGSDVSGTSTLIFQDTEYDVLGNLYRKSRPYFQGATSYWTSYLYDKLGRVTDANSPTDTAASGAITHTTYLGLTVSVTDPLNHTTTQVSNAAGQVATVTDALGGALTRTYDPVGNLVRTEDAKGNITSIKYDTRGRKEALYDPDMGVWTYKYNALGEMVGQTDAKGQSSSMVYDALGRLTSRVEASLTSTWSYDKYADGSACAKGIGKLCEAVAGNGYRRKNVYDSLGRPSSTTTTVGSAYTSSVTYDSFGRVSTQTYPTGLVVQNTYTAGLGFLKSLLDTRTNGALWTANAVDAVGHLTQYTFGNSVVSTNQFFATSARLSSAQAGPGNSVQDLSVSHDNLGRLISRVDARTGVTSAYDYDELNRVKTENRWGGSLPAAQAIAWTYDAIGNMATRKESGSTNTYNYNPSGAGSRQPHAVANVSGFVNGYGVPIYTYDDNGNLLSGAGRTVTWNSFNKVATIASANTRLELLYDTEHQRAQETYYQSGALQRTTIYLGSYEDESGTAGVKKKHYISAGGTTIGMIVCTAVPCTNTANTSTQYWHTDDLGSVSVVTNAAGVVTERMAYEPFGKRRASSGVTDTNGTLTSVSTNRGFTGHEEMDEVGLVNMNGRIYDPGLGRFMSADPFIQSSNSLQSYNRYAYVWNNPLNATDPSGYFSLGGWLDNVTKAHFWPSDTNVFNMMRSQPGQAQIDRYIANHRWAYSVGKIAVTAAAYYYSGGNQWAAAGAAAYWDGYYTYYQTGDMWAARRAGGQDMAAAGLYNWAGYYPGWSVVTHAAIGCASSYAAGGKCGSGAAAGAFGAAFGGGNAEPQSFTEFAGDVAYNAMIGGIGSRLGGGTFADGAVTGAFGYLFNCLSHPDSCAKLFAKAGATVGAGLGAIGGIGASAACDAASGGVCALLNPVIVAASTLEGGVQGAVAGAVVGTVVDTIEQKINGNSWLSPDPTSVYVLRSNANGSILKFGITNLVGNETGRYSFAELTALNANMTVIATYDSRAPARMLEIGLCMGYVAANGKLPPASSKC